MTALKGNASIATIALREECQPRAAGLSPEIVEEYREALERGETLPPLSVVSVLDGELEAYVVVDGYHRYAAHRQRGAKRIPIVEVGEGDLSVAIWHSLRANLGHGVRRTLEDKARAVARAIALRPDASDREIARHVQVSHRTVAAHRRAGAGGGQLTTLEAEPGGQLSTLDDDDSGQREPREGSGAIEVSDEPEPTETERAVRTAAEAAESILVPLSAARRAALAARDDPALGDAIDRAAREIKASIVAIQMAVPVVHAACGGLGCARCAEHGWVRTRSEAHS